MCASVLLLVSCLFVFFLRHKINRAILEKKGKKDVPYPQIDKVNTLELFNP